DLQVVLALPGGQAVVQFTGLGVHQIGRELARVPPEERIGQGDVAPVEADQVQAHQEHCQSVDQPGGGVRGQVAAEQCPVGQGELQVLGDQHRVQRFAL